MSELGSAMSIDSTDGSFFASYDEMTWKECKEMAARRGIKPEGTKAQLVKMLKKTEKQNKENNKTSTRKSNTKTPFMKKSKSKPTEKDLQVLKGLHASGLI